MFEISRDMFNKNIERALTVYVLVRSVIWNVVEVLLAKPKTKMERMNNNSKSKHIIIWTASVSKQRGKHLEFLGSVVGKLYSIDILSYSIAARSS